MWKKKEYQILLCTADSVNPDNLQTTGKAALHTL